VKLFSLLMRVRSLVAYIVLEKKSKLVKIIIKLMIAQMFATVSSCCCYRPGLNSDHRNEEIHVNVLVVCIESVACSSLQQVLAFSLALHHTVWAFGA